jgi:hypothetical protein
MLQYLVHFNWKGNIWNWCKLPDNLQS